MLFAFSFSLFAFRFLVFLKRHRRILRASSIVELTDHEHIHRRAYLFKVDGAQHEALVVDGAMGIVWIAYQRIYLGFAPITILWATFAPGI